MSSKNKVYLLFIICIFVALISACTKTGSGNNDVSNEDVIEVTIPPITDEPDKEDKLSDVDDDSRTAISEGVEQQEYTGSAEENDTYEDLAMTAHNYQPEEEIDNPYPERVINITNIRELSKVLKASFQTAYTLIDQYAAEHNLAAQNVTMVGYFLDGEFGQRTPIYLRYDDPNETMAMLIYDMTYPEPSNAVQIQDSDMTMGDVRLQWWYKEE